MNLTFLNCRFTVNIVSIVNKPKVSKTITRMYMGLVAFVGFIGLLFISLGIFTPMGVTGFIAGSILLVLIEPILILIISSLYKTRYILTDDELVIKTTVLIGGRKRIPLNKIESVEKTLIPFGFKLFGASFHGGYYSIPGLGRAFLAITNFEDGLLIKTKNRNYIITPSNASDFQESIKSRLVLRPPS